IEMWIGGTDLFSEGHWEWAGNRASLIRDGLITDWQSGQPGGNTGENCMVVSRGYRYKWADFNCNRALPFVCELT
ncbi:hypothetical protein BaRGS_00034892, partial [Batillaria attramentaria]